VIFCKKQTFFADFGTGGGAAVEHALSFYPPFMPPL
jgi:hypothetical protein